jgi:hypothetical protein
MTIPTAPANGVYISQMIRYSRACGSYQDFLDGGLLKPLYEVCLIRIKEQIGEKRNTVCTHRYADCLLKNTSTKHNKYVVNQKLEHVENISFRVVIYKIRSVSS